MSLNRRDLLKALGAAPLCGMLGVAPEEEKILRKVDPEFVETVERPQLGRDQWKMETDVFIQEINVCAFEHELAEASYTLQVNPRDRIRLVTHNIADSVRLLEHHNGLSCHMTLSGRIGKDF